MTGQWHQAAGRTRRALIVAGPTCSGKSALAVALAQRFGGTVVNADSMQVYRELRILTARPTPAEEALAPHRLYGIRPAAEPGSTAWWRGEALAAMDQAATPILCGGTGLYFRSLTTGLSDIPDPGEAARQEARTLVDTLGSAALHERLVAVDPAAAARIRPGDGQRVARAWEVWRGTGRSLTAWQAAVDRPPWDFGVIVLDPPRTDLRVALTARFAAMMRAGALAEVAALDAMRLDPALPAMRAHGVTELLAALRGQATLAEAEQRTVLATAQYTKRQATWFRHQSMADPQHTHTIHARFEAGAQLPESLAGFCEQFLHLCD